MTFLAYKFQLRFNLNFLICSSALFQFAFCWNFCLSGRWPLFRDFSFFHYFPTSSLNLIIFRQRSEPSWKKLVYGAPARLENKMQLIYGSQKVEKDMHIRCLPLETCASLSTHVQIRLRFVSLFFQLFVVTKRFFFQGRVMSNLRSCLFACVFVYLSLWKGQNQTASCLYSGCQV